VQNDLSLGRAGGTPFHDTKVTALRIFGWRILRPPRRKGCGVLSFRMSLEARSSREPDLRQSCNEIANKSSKIVLKLAPFNRQQIYSKIQTLRPFETHRGGSHPEDQNRLRKCAARPGIVFGIDGRMKKIAQPLRVEGPLSF
jgi:hypothetical protein